jgi:hypothetical protein
MHPSLRKEGKSAVSVAIGLIAANYTILLALLTVIMMSYATSHQK